MIFQVELFILEQLWNFGWFKKVLIIDGQLMEVVNFGWFFPSTLCKNFHHLHFWPSNSHNWSIVSHLGHPHLNQGELLIMMCCVHTPLVELYATRRGLSWANMLHAHHTTISYICFLIYISHENKLKFILFFCSLLSFKP